MANLTKSSLLFAAGTFLSRVTGLLRDIIVTAFFGAGIMLDAFLIAFRIPNLFREMLAEGALANAFTKVFAELFESDPKRAKQFFADTLLLVTLVGMIISVTGILLAPSFVNLMTSFSEPDPQLVENATHFTRILFPFLAIMMVGAIFAGALHQYGRFFSSAIAPIGFNMGYIFGATVLAAWFAGLPFHFGEKVARQA